jgi:hypothetical protein
MRDFMRRAVFGLLSRLQNQDPGAEPGYAPGVALRQAIWAMWPSRESLRMSDELPPVWQGFYASERGLTEDDCPTLSGHKLMPNGWRVKETSASNEE